MTPDKKSFFQRFKKSIISVVVFIMLMLAFADWLGFKHVPEHVHRAFFIFAVLFLIIH
jgi:uncharacterized membrane protein